MKNITHSLTLGMFDSGFGGISLLRNLVHELGPKSPSLKIHYIGDHLCFPYGEKSPEYLLNRTTKLTQYLQKVGSHHVVLACNTATLNCLSLLEKSFTSIKFTGVRPLVGFSEFSKGALILTKASSQSKELQNLVQNCDIDLFPSQNLANIAENYIQGHDLEFEKLIINELSLLIEQSYKYQYVLLGSTHYVIIKHFLEKILQIKCVEPNSLIIKTLKENLLNQEDPERFNKTQIFIESTAPNIITSKLKNNISTYIGNQDYVDLHFPESTFGDIYCEATQ